LLNPSLPGHPPFATSLQVFDYPSISEICQYLAAEGYGQEPTAGTAPTPAADNSGGEHSFSSCARPSLAPPAQRQAGRGQALAVQAVHAALRHRVPVLPVLRDGLGPADPGLTHVLPLDPELDVVQQVYTWLLI
jgi:hypothetical protein